MITPDAELAIKLVSVSKIIVTEYQVRYPDRLQHYINLMSRNTTDFPGFILLKPRADGYFEVEDGHHRFLAHIMTGRDTVLAIVIKEPERDTTREDQGPR